MRSTNKDKKSAVNYVKKSDSKKKPVVIPLLAKHNPRPHRCGACYFYEAHCKRSYSKQVAKLAPFIKDPKIVPHVVPNDFDDPEYKYKVMRNTYMINSGKKSQEIFQLKKQLQRKDLQLQQKDLELQKVQEEIRKLRHQVNGTAPLSRPKNPKPKNRPAAPDERHQCPNCSKFMKNIQSYYDHIQKCGKTWTCPICEKTIKKSSKGNHKNAKSCKPKQ